MAAGRSIDNRPRSDELRHLNDNEFQRLADLIGPNAIVDRTLPSVTGDRGADQRISELAEGRGYRQRAQISSLDLVWVSGRQLAPDAAQAWLALEADARRHGVSLALGSGFRSIRTQRRIFVNKLNRYGYSTTAIAAGRPDAAIDQILTLSSIPGYSKHHTGYTLDICRPATASRRLPLHRRSGGSAPATTRTRRDTGSSPHIRRRPALKARTPNPGSTSTSVPTASSHSTGSPPSMPTGLPRKEPRSSDGSRHQMPSSISMSMRSSIQTPLRTSTGPMSRSQSGPRQASWDSPSLPWSTPRHRCLRRCHAADSHRRRLDRVSATRTRLATPPRSAEPTVRHSEPVGHRTGPSENADGDEVLDKHWANLIPLRERGVPEILVHYPSSPGCDQPAQCCRRPVRARRRTPARERPSPQRRPPPDGEDNKRRRPAAR